MSNDFTKAFHGFGRELLEKVRQTVDERITDAELVERIIGIEKATISMLEVGVDEEEIIKMLQKHWDLRLSEAKTAVDNCKKPKLI